MTASIAEEKRDLGKELSLTYQQQLAKNKFIPKSYVEYLVKIVIYFELAK